MSRIMVRCPETGTPVDTGMNFDKQGFERARISGNAFMCSACKRMHMCRKDQVYFEED